MMNKKKKIIFVRSNHINPDPRIEKEISYLLDYYNIEVLGWDREKECQKVENKNGYKIYRCQIKGNYGSKIKNAINLIIWFFYEFFWLMTHSFEIIHACDFDTCLPALIVAKIRKKKIIYDIFDFYSDMIFLPKIFTEIIKRLDLFLIQFVDGVILCDDNRKEQIKGSNPKKITVIYNTPKDYFNIFKSNIEKARASNNFTLGYIGLLHKTRGLDSMIDLVKRLRDINLIIGGWGPYEKEIKRKIIGVRNIQFLGKVFPYKKTIEILSKCDALFAIYDPRVPNHKYSSPNKLFEAMMLSKPIIVSKNTGMDEKVKQYQCGIVVDYDNINEIVSAIKELKVKKSNNDNNYGINGRKVYENLFHPKIMQERILNFYRDL